MTYSILIADDHPLFREALTYIVKSVITDATITEATNYSETKVCLDQANFSLVFLDLNMPDSNGLTDLALIKKLHPSVPIVVVSAHEEPDIIRTCLEYNASGYIIKSSAPDDIKKAITTILAGNIYAPKGLDISCDANDPHQIASDQIGSLTPSQLKVLIEMGKGKLNKQIAYDLEITEATVKAHITTVFKKLKINNRTQAVIFAKEHQARNPELK
jgi:DNA-binding NarL/FixJ family response regulator